MRTIWIVSDQADEGELLAPYLRDLAEIHAGPAERARFRERPAPDLLIVAPLGAPAGDVAGLERVLGFLRSVPSSRRTPPPVLYVEPSEGQPSCALARDLIDDRPVESLVWPLEPQTLREACVRLLNSASSSVSLRERARREWVSRRVELLYAGLDLPSLRQAIDPRGSARPILISGESGTRKGLLARYIHALAEPARAELVLIPAEALQAGRVESRIHELCGGRRVTLHLSAPERAERTVQEEIAELLTQSGELALESVRWILSTSRAGTLPASFEGAPWIRVDLPALRARPDLDALMRGLLIDLAAGMGREVSLGDDALKPLRSRAWLGNLRELEEVLHSTLSAASGSAVSAERLAPSRVPPAARFEQEPDAELEPEIELEPAPPRARETPRQERRAEREVPAEVGPPPAVSPVPASALESTVLADLVQPLVHEIRQPLLAIRTYAGLLEQRPDDEKVRRELSGLVERDLPELESLLTRLERFARFREPRVDALNLAQVVASELERIAPTARARSLVVLRELEAAASPARADESWLRFALAGLLGQALRMVPDGGDLYVGTHWQSAANGRPARHRVLIRFHSPEDVLIAPDETQGPRMTVEVLMARALIQRMHGSFAVDTSGAQDNVILIELQG